MAVNGQERRRAEDAADRYSAPALEKGLDILELLSGTAAGLTQRQIGEALGRSASEIFRMLTCLEQRGYILRTRPEDLYHLSAKMFVLAHRYPPTHRLHEAALPILRRLAGRTGQSAHLGVAHRGQLLILAQADAPGFMGFVIRPGTCVPLHTTSSGAVLAAFQDDATRRQWFQEAGAELSDNEAKVFERRLAQVRRKGHTQTPSRNVKGITDLSAPVLDQNGRATAAITVPYLATPQGDRKTVGEALNHLLAAAAELSRFVAHDVNG